MMIACMRGNFGGGWGEQMICDRAMYQDRRSRLYFPTQLRAFISIVEIEIEISSMRGGAPSNKIIKAISIERDVDASSSSLILISCACSSPAMGLHPAAHVHIQEAAANPHNDDDPLPSAPS
jgi:hypothetical protein